METCGLTDSTQAVLANSDKFGSFGPYQDSPNANLYSPTTPVIEVCRYSSPHFSSSASEQDPATPPQAYVTEKKVEYPPYDAAVVDLFGSRDNTWVNTCSRPTALGMWDVKEGGEENEEENGEGYGEENGYENGYEHGEECGEDE